MTGILIDTLSVTYGRRTVLDAVSLAVDEGETLVLFGPSGAGKSVLLRAVAGLEPAAAVGRVMIGGADVSLLPPERRGLGVAFQNFALYPHFTAFENIASPLRARGMAVGEIERRVRKVAELLKIGHVLGQFPRELSNGQKQRTALARALAGEPRAILLDDPLRNVDAKLRYEMRLELPRLLRGFGAAVIYVTQDFREAMALGDRVAILRDGTIRQVGTPEDIYATPDTVEVARLFGDPPMNLLPVTAELRGGTARVEVAGFSFAFSGCGGVQETLVGLRPDALTLAEPGEPLAASMSVVADTPLHDRHVLLLRASDGAELVASSRTAPTAEAVWVKANGALLFDAGSGRRLAGTPQAERAVA